jgi:nitric oxide synthase oxygenase domain/subunit
MFTGADMQTQVQIHYWPDLHHYGKQRKVVNIIDRALPLSHNTSQISKNNKLVWKNEAHVELNCNVIYQVSRN